MGGRDFKVRRREWKGLRVLRWREAVEGLRDLVGDVDAPMSRCCGSWEVGGVVEKGRRRVPMMLLGRTELFVRDREGWEADGRGGGQGSRGVGAGDGCEGSCAVLLELVLKLSWKAGERISVRA